MRQLYKNYPVFPKDTPLTFSHYLALQRVRNPQIRLRLEQRAIKQKLSVLDVKGEVANIKQLKENSEEGRLKKLQISRGEPYVYSQRLETCSSQKGCLGYARIDCGFKINIDPPPGPESLSLCSRTVRAVKEDGRYRLLIEGGGSSLLYTYAAEVIRVIDGDTLDVRIDVGFGIYLNDRLRLKGINAPERNTPGGQRAKKFLEEYFSRCSQLVIRTFKEGMYGRWIADIFAQKGCNDPVQIAKTGELVNQVLLDEGLAILF